VTVDVRGHRVHGQQRVQPLDHLHLLVPRGGLEHRSQVTLEATQHSGVTVDQLGHEPRAVRQEYGQAVVALQRGVDQPRSTLGVTDEVHRVMVRGSATM
jgi:hypothetical protein